MTRWTPEQANEWYRKLPWLVGCDFIPSTAINQLEMWQADTFDLATIDRELGWAAGLGMNTVRVYLHDLAWKTYAPGFFSRIERFLEVAARHRIRPLFALFDDCWNAYPQVGKQPQPSPGVHNSGWLQSPGVAAVNDPAAWRDLERYVLDLLGRFGQDQRILLWDLYNEPGNSKQDERSLPLLCKVFEWARAANPVQPLTAGLWYNNAALKAFQLAASDVITFHNYENAAHLTAQIAELRSHGRPLICTEWLRRGHSEVAANLPIFHRERVGCINWGLVNGKTQTIYPWGSPKDAPEPALWFHDLLKADGAAFNPEEVRLFKELPARP